MTIEPEDERAEREERVERWADLPVPPDEAWPRIGGFLSIVDWHPALTSGETLEIDGRLHRCVLTTYGAPILERLEEEGERLLRVSVVESLLPLDAHEATLRCIARPAGCRVFWTATFRSPSPRAFEIIDNIHRIGLAALAARYGGTEGDAAACASTYARAS
ncbi:SRPBCC family protein [Albimonas pacifica]|uniref:Polyketide cyclase / dehydrase and lipid transport n=1 Tax=Albimonas pacifica TaxID=1114924 RepID=A0A1I3E2Q1_9RHOB|nr:SRPBCC family protein [Albimonas pacifica]SFH93133.1 Polyketide cyclase / dehydrase and lipid transport [Albimonas pacifica]